MAKLSELLSARSEQDEQIAVFEWAEMMTPLYPPLKMLHASLAGNVKIAPKYLNLLKKMGAKKGIPDIFLPVPTAQYSGLWIEMKRRKRSNLSMEQKRWLDDLNDYGYYACVCEGSDAAIACISQYLGIAERDRITSKQRMKK